MNFTQDLPLRRCAGNYPNPDDITCTITARVREFSNVFIHNPDGEKSKDFIDYNVSNVYFRISYPIVVYPNGYDSSTEGSVSVLVKRSLRQLSLFQVRHVKLNCVIAVIDSEGCRRFPQSFVIDRDISANSRDSNFAIHNCISRSVLLNEPTEWLPSDTLTLQLEFGLEQNYYAYGSWNIESTPPLDTDFKTVDGPHGSSLYLSMDSEFAKRLVEESNYFERLMCTQFVEKSSRWVKISPEDYDSFRVIRRIIYDVDAPIDFESIKEVLSLYVTADMYGISTVINTCRCWLKLGLTPNNASEISEFVNIYNDEHLKETLKTFLGSGGKEGGDVKKNDQSNTPSGNEDWVMEAGYPTNKFQYRLNDGKRGEKQNYEFYY